MSSYLNFYVVPRLSKKKYDYTKDDGHTEVEIKLSEGLPLLLLNYSRNSDIYQAYNDTLNPAYGGMEEKYTELSYEDAQRVAREFENDLEKSEQRLAINYKMLKEGGYSSELWEEIQSGETYVAEQKESLEELRFIANLVYEIKTWGDFEKILINID